MPISQARMYEILEAADFFLLRYIWGTKRAQELLEAIPQNAPSEEAGEFAAKCVRSVLEAITLAGDDPSGIDIGLAFECIRTNRELVKRNWRSNERAAVRQQRYRWRKKNDVVLPPQVIRGNTKSSHKKSESAGMIRPPPKRLPKPAEPTEEWKERYLAESAQIAEEEERNPPDLDAIPGFSGDR